MRRASVLEPSEQEALQYLFQKNGPSGMRRPLQMSVNLSPVVLLLDLELDSQRYRESAIIKVVNLFSFPS